MRPAATRSSAFPIQGLLGWRAWDLDLPMKALVWNNEWEKSGGYLGKKSRMLARKSRGWRELGRGKCTWGTYFGGPPVETWVEHEMSIRTYESGHLTWLISPRMSTPGRKIPGIGNWLTYFRKESLTFISDWSDTCPRKRIRRLKKRGRERRSWLCLARISILTYHTQEIFTVQWIQSLQSLFKHIPMVPF